MFTRMILVILVVFVLAGCATDSKKQAAQSQSFSYEKSRKAHQDESYSGDYDYDDTWLSESYERSEKKTYSGTAIQLSPKQIQRALKSAGFYKGPIDGKIGLKTKGAIIKFQKANGLRSDGIVGKKTSAQLNKHLMR